MKEKWKGIDSATLKWIAIISMLVDHYAIAIYAQVEYPRYEVYRAMRLIGRIAFPIYCFLLVEGFFYTKNVVKYILRCAIFGVLSEIPFDMAMYGQIVYWESQNVYFTLCLGLVVIAILEKCNGSMLQMQLRQIADCTITWEAKKQTVLKVLIQVLVIAAGLYVGEHLEVDYHAFGIAAIVVFYYVRSMHPLLRDVVVAYMFAFETTAPLAIIPIHLYNGKRGASLKYLFYMVYPVHLLIYGLLRMY